MYYILIMDGAAHESIPEFDESFPGVPIDERYTADFLAQCVTADEPVPDGWLYDPETRTFSAPPEPEPVPVPEPDIEAIRAAKLAEIGTACESTIYAGIEYAGARYSLTEHDQIELMAQQSAVLAGAPAVPYHADGELCRMYPAAEFAAIAGAATAHIFYNRTYCNHLNVWIRRAEVDELDAIFYGAELPPDLAENMAEILAAAGGGA